MNAGCSGRLAVLLMVGLAAQAAASTSAWPILSWNTHWQCGSDHVKGCRASATASLLALANSSRAAVVVSIELETSDTLSVDVRKAPPALNPSGWVNSGWSRVAGSCPAVGRGSGDALSLNLAPGFALLASGGGCLGGHSSPTFKADARAFAVALVTPPAEAAVGGCPGVCVIALHSPHNDISQGAGTVAKVCGDAASAGCVIAIGTSTCCCCCCSSSSCCCCC